MRVLLLSPLPPPAGGMATWTEQYVEYMKKYNTIDVVNTAVIGKRSKEYSGKSTIEEIKRFLLIFIHTLTHLLTSKYDIVHFNTSCSGKGLIRDYYIVRLIRFFNKRIILHCHCNLNNTIKFEEQKNYFSKIVHISTKILTLNTASEYFVKENYAVNTLTVPNFIDNSYYSVVDEEKTISPIIKKIVYVGHLRHTKGCDNIIRVAKKFPNIEFKLVGHKFKEITDMPMTDNVILTGELSKNEVRKAYREADLMLFPTHTEGFPLVVIEAMAHGLPFITTKVGAIEDILEDKGAVYVPIDDDDAIIDALHNIAEDSCRRKKMSDFNRQKVKTTYFIEHVLKDMQRIYEKEL